MNVHKGDSQNGMTQRCGAELTALRTHSGCKHVCKTVCQPDDFLTDGVGARRADETL